MFIIYIVLLLVLTAGVGRVGYNLTPARRLERSLSRPAQELLKEYNAIPSESRPFPDLGSILKALDEKHSDELEELTKHYQVRKRGYDSTRYFFSWSGDSYCPHSVKGDRYRNRCPFPDYYRIHSVVEDVQASIKEKEVAIRDSRLKGSLDMIDELETRLRDEVEVNRSFVKEFKELA